MLRLLIYGYSVGVRSSRAIERKCIDDIGFRFLAADCVLSTHGDDDPPDDYGLIARTVPEVHRLFTLHDELRDLPALIAQQRTDFHLRWSTWRRRHQARARAPT